MIPDSVVKQIENKYQHLSPLLNERSRRLWAATEAEALGYGGMERAIAEGTTTESVATSSFNLLPID